MTNDYRPTTIDQRLSTNEDEISLKELILKIKEWFNYLLSRWMIILVVGIIGGVIGLGYAINQKPTYTGKLIFVLSNEKSGGSGFASLAGQFGLNVGGSSDGMFSGENIMELLKTPRIVKNALFTKMKGDNRILVNYIGDTIGLFKGWKQNKYFASSLPFPDNPEKLTPLQDSLFRTIHGLVLGIVKIDKPDKKLSFYSVTATSPNERLAVYLPKVLIDAAAQMYIDTKTKTSKQTLDMLQNEADMLSAKLSGTIYSSAATTDQTFNLNPAFQTQRSPVQQNQVQVQALGAAYGEVVKQLELAKITLQKETPLYQIIDEPQMPLIKQRFSKLKGLKLGGIIGGFLCVFFLLGRRVFQGVMEE